MPDAMDVYRTMCEYLETNGWYRRSPDEGGWWDRDEDYGDMQIGDAVMEQLVLDGLDLRNPPPDKTHVSIDPKTTPLPPWPTIAPHPDDNLF